MLARDSENVCIIADESWFLIKIYVKHEFTLFRWEMMLVINTSLLKFSFNNQTTSSPIFFVGDSEAS